MKEIMTIPSENKSIETLCSQCKSTCGDQWLSRLDVVGTDEQGRSKVVSQLWCRECFEKVYQGNTEVIAREVTPEQLKFEQEFEQLQSQHFMDADIVDRWHHEAPQNMTQWYRNKYMEAQLKIRSLTFELQQLTQKLEGRE